MDNQLIYNHVVESAQRVFSFLFFLFFLFNFVVWKKILKYFQKFNKSSQIYTTKKKKVTLLFVQKQQNLSEKTKPPTWVSMWDWVGLEEDVHSCHLWSCGVIKYYAKWRTWEDIRCSENANLLVLVPYIIPGQFDPPGIGYKTDSWLVWGRYKKSSIYNGIKLIHGWYEHW